VAGVATATFRVWEQDGRGIRETGVVRKNVLSDYLRSDSADIAEVRVGLWNPAVDAAAYADGQYRYQEAIFEQYKLCVEMADRVSARRGVANGFFLSLNTAVLTAAGVLWSHLTTSAWLLLFPLAVLLVQTGAWFWLIRSYRQLNTAKYVVVGAMEERLPASPYWRAEWNALGEGKSKARYWPLTHLEQWVPVIFAGLYLVGFIVAVVTRN
jgi:hypothetical protein